MELIQSVGFNYPVLMVASSDHITGKTGVELTIYLSKAGGPFQLITPLVIETGFGEYTVVLTPAHTSTLGALSLHVTAAGADPFDSIDQVVPAPQTSLLPDAGTVATLALLKRLLGIDADNTDDDAYLSQLLANATVDVEGMTKRRFQEPISLTEYRDGNGEELLYLHGHIDDVNAVDSGSDDPADSLVVLRRTKRFRGSPSWEMLTEDEDYERRGDTLLFMRLWGVWPCEDELKITYLNGYTVPPEDIRAAIVDIAMNQYLADLAASSGTSGVTGEKLGDFSYTVDLGAVAGGSTALSDTTQRTIQRYKRRFV